MFNNSPKFKEAYVAPLLRAALGTVLLLSGAVALDAEACTTAIITKGASADGNTYVTHSNDTFSSNPSIVYVPAHNYPKGSLRPVYPSAIAWEDYPEFNCYTTPRLVAPERTPSYASTTHKVTLPLGYIPQVEHTYAYLDSDYAIMNEQGLMLGECTNNGATCEYLAPVKGKNLFYASELGRVALERCTKAREAVELMGKLIDTYGIWGTGETILVADKEEGWVLEMQPDPSGKGFWIAQRVPDGEFFVASNIFRIRDIRLGSKDQLFNPQLPEQLQKAGLAVVNPASGLVDWVSSIKTVEDFHPYFALRRIWRVQQLVAPSQQLSAKVSGPTTKAYPFAVRPDKPLGIKEIFKLHRDHMQGTELDLAKGSNAGLFQSPYRYKAEESFERSINYAKTGYTWIAQSQGAIATPLCWLALSTPRDNVFVPFVVSDMPESYTKVDRKNYDPQKMWWTATRVDQLAKGYYSILSPTVLAQAEALEQKSLDLLHKNKALPKERLAKLLRQNAAENQQIWEKLFGDLLVQLNQGAGVKHVEGTVKADNVEQY